MSVEPDKSAGCPIESDKCSVECGDCAKTSENDSKLTKEDEKKVRRSVRFPDEEQIVTQYFEPANPWQDVPLTTRSQLAAEYLESCRKHKTICIDSVLQQIRELPEACIGGSTRAPRLTLSECVLVGPAPADALEAVLRKVQFRRIEIDHALIDDEGAEALFDMIEYYESATAVCITGPRQYGIRGWQATSRMIKKSAELLEVEVTDGPIEASHAPVLARSMQPLTCRLRALCLQRVGLCGDALLCLVIALKLNNSLRELRLGDNQLSPTDAAQLASLLKYNNRIQLLDLSNNQIQDAGVSHLATALSEQASHSPSSATASPLSPHRCQVGGYETRGLAFLVLWNNQLTRNCAPHISKALRSCSSLCVLNIGRNAVGSDAVRAAVAGSLVSLGLQAAKLGPDAAQPLAELIRQCHNLQRLDLRENRLGSAGLQAILTAMKDNSTLTQIDLDEPPEATNLSAEDSEASLVKRMTREIRTLCRRNEPPARPDEHHPVHRKISLTCHTVCLLRQGLGGEEERRGSGGGRLRSPAPSPAPSPGPSPAGSPVPPPHPNSRFSVTRVTPDRDSSSDSCPSTPTRSTFCHTSSRFKVMQVMEPPQIQVHPVSSPRKSASRFSVTRNYDTMYNPSPSPPASPACTMSASPTPVKPSVTTNTPLPISVLSTSIEREQKQVDFPSIKESKLPFSEDVNNVAVDKTVLSYDNKIESELNEKVNKIVTDRILPSKADIPIDNTALISKKESYIDESVLPIDAKIDIEAGDLRLANTFDQTMLQSDNIEPRLEHKSDNQVIIEKPVTLMEKPHLQSVEDKSNVVKLKETRLHAENISEQLAEMKISGNTHPLKEITVSKCDTKHQLETLTELFETKMDSTKIERGLTESKKEVTESKTEPTNFENKCYAHKVVPETELITNIVGLSKETSEQFVDVSVKEIPIKHSINDQSVPEIVKKELKLRTDSEIARNDSNHTINEATSTKLPIVESSALRIVQPVPETKESIISDSNLSNTMIESDTKHVYSILKSKVDYDILSSPNSKIQDKTMSIAQNKSEIEGEDPKIEVFTDNKDISDITKIKDNVKSVTSDLKYSEVVKSTKQDDNSTMKQIVAITEDLGNIIKEMRILVKDNVQLPKKDIVLKKNKSESSLDSPDLEVSRLTKKMSSVFDSNSSLEISGSSMESLNEHNKTVQELDRRKSGVILSGSSLESEAMPVNNNLLNLSVSSNDSVSPIFGKTKQIHDSLSSLEASVSSLESGKHDRLMVTSADSGIEYSLQNPAENKEDNSSNEGTLTNNSSLKENVKKSDDFLENLTISPKRASSLLDVPALKNKGLDRMRKISWVPPSSSFQIPKPEEKETKPSHLEKLLSLFQHPSSIFSRSTSDDEKKLTSNTPPRKDSSLTSSFWTWGSTIERDKEEDSSEATDSTLSERVQVSFVDESFSRKLDSKTPSTDTDNTLSEFQSFPQESESEKEKVTVTTEDKIVQKLDISVNSKAIEVAKNGAIDLVKEKERENVNLEQKEEMAIARPRSFAAVLKSSGSENTLDKQNSPDNGQSVDKLPSKVIRGIKENISPENTLTSSMTNTKTLAEELERQAKNPAPLLDIPLKSEPRLDDIKIPMELAPIATIEEADDLPQLAYIDDVKIEDISAESIDKKYKEIDVGKDALSYLMFENKDFHVEAENIGKTTQQDSLAQELKDAEIKEKIDLSPELVIDGSIEPTVFTAKEVIGLRTSPIIPERAKLKKSNSLEDLSLVEAAKSSPKTKTIAFKVPESTTPRDIPERRTKLRTRSGSSPKSLPESLNKPCPLTKMDSIMTKKKKKVSSLGKMAKDSLLALNMSEEEIAEFRRSYKLTSVESLKSLESVSEDANSQSGNSMDSRCRACLRTSQESLMSLDSITEDCRCTEDCEKPGRSAR